MTTGSGFDPTAGFDAIDAPRAVMIGGDADEERAGRDAVALVGGRVLAKLGWDEVERGLAGHEVAAVVLVEAASAAPEELAAALPRIDMFARTADVSVVVALDDRQIDQVSGNLLGGNVQLLCRPSLAERVAALALARAQHGGAVLEDAGVEGERLRRLNEEVARIAATLARLTQHDPAPPMRVPPIVADRTFDYGAPPAAALSIDPADVRKAIRSRRLRDQFFREGMFEDPAWDILLDLYAAHLEHTQVSVSSLCIAAAVAPTTALRWIGKMIDAELLVRQPDPMDRRRAFMALSPRSIEAMEAYVASAQRQGLAIA